MDQTAKNFLSDGMDARKWTGRILMAVILGEAIWNLIVSVMNNLVVPWLGDVMGQSSGLPTSFTRRPYDYPDLFVSVVEFCIAGITAVTLNYFCQRTRSRGRIKPVKNSLLIAPADAAPPVREDKAMPVTTARPFAVEPTLPNPKPEPVTMPAPVMSAPPSPAIAKPSEARPAMPPPRAEPAKPQKPKEVYYNIVGEPVSSDDD